MTHKQIDAMREVRLWIGQVIVPALGVGAVLMTNPAVKQTVMETCEKAKMKIKNFTKKE